MNTLIYVGFNTSSTFKSVRRNGPKWHFCWVLKSANCWVEFNRGQWCLLEWIQYTSGVDLQKQECLTVCGHPGTAAFLLKNCLRPLYWAIPEIKCTPPKEDMGIPKILTTFFIGKSKKIKLCFGCKGKEDMGIPKIFHHF